MQTEMSRILLGSPYEMQTEMPRGPLAEDEPSREGTAAGLILLLILHLSGCISLGISYGDRGVSLTFLSGYARGKLLVQNCTKSRNTSKHLNTCLRQVDVS